MNSTRRWHLCFTLVLMVLASVAEIVTIGAVLPFLAIASNGSPDLLGESAIDFLTLLHSDTLTAATIILCAAALVAAAIRLLLIRTIQRLIELFGHELAHAIFDGMLKETYADHLERSSSHYSSIITMVQDVVFGFIQPLMQGTISAFMAVTIAVLLVIISPFAATLGLLFFFFVYFVMNLFTSPKLNSHSKTIAKNTIHRAKIVQESFGGFRDIILDQSYDAVVGRFDAADTRYRRAKSVNNIISSSPRFVIEAIGIVVITLITWSLGRFGSDFQTAIPILGAMALGAQRMLPMVQSAWSGCTLAIGNRQLFNEVQAYASAPAPKSPERLPRASFKQNIVFDKVSYAYARGDFCLENISFQINKGEHLGISGITGSGKSTLVDLLLGLIEPIGGEIRIDQRKLSSDWRSAWHGCIAHVPQSIFLVDDSIAANITLGAQTDPLDQRKLENVVKASQLWSFIETLDAGLETSIGEDGIRISGGQRQRIGIARALYRNPDLLILDEATSALDDATETALFEAIDSLSIDMTVVSVAHRASTLSRCDRTLYMKQSTKTKTKRNHTALDSSGNY